MVNNTPIYDNLVKERPITDAELDEMLRQIENAPTAKCEAKHYIKGWRRSTDTVTLEPMPTPCSIVAEYVFEDSHKQLIVCASFVQDWLTDTWSPRATVRPI